MTRDDLVRIALAIASVALLSVLQGLLNRKRLHRGLQFPMPILALVYAAAATVVLCRHEEWAAIIIKRYPILTDSDVLLLNLMLLAGFLPLKLILLPILTRIWKKRELMEQTSGTYYEYDQVSGEWFLRKKWTDHRAILKTLCIVVLVVNAALLAVTWAAGKDSAWWIWWFPTAALCVAGEATAFLNGQTKEEFGHRVSGEDADSRSIRNYFKLREIYEKLFGDKLLASHSGCEFNAWVGSTQFISELAASADPIERNTAEYFRTYGDYTFDNDRVMATLQLMRGNSVVFFNPFYRDLDPYLTYPMVNTLLKGGKCLVVCGRNSTAEDALSWLQKLFVQYSHVRALWRVRSLDSSDPDCEVGVLSFRQLYDMDVQAANRSFFEKTGFVLLLEPSVMVNTGQMGLSVICEATSGYNDPPVYCICDRFTDGLVDTMSHLLRTEITHVVAAPAPRSIYSGMAWDADGDYRRQELFDKQTEFLGNGVELAAVAVKNQIPRVTWHSEKKVPLRDLRWIAGQFYTVICRYMCIPVQQKALEDKLRFVPNLWCSGEENESFLLVEDEFCNLFSTMRAFLSRGTQHSFVNVLAEDYLLRDYMRCNQQMFLSNPNAVPSFVPDYAKTERNTVLKLLMKMAVAPVPEQEVEKELLLAGCHVGNVLETFSRLMKKYTFTDGSILEIRSVTEDDAQLSARKVNQYSLPRENYDRYFADSLKNAYYIVEEEQREREYVDAKMFGHIPQTVLPGQFVTYDGKYYLVRTVSPENGIILRRASDLYTGRRYYRQLRTYDFSGTDWTDIRYSRTVMDVETAVICCDFQVTTEGYLDMDSMKDLRMARVVSFQGDPSCGDFLRRYRSKNVLRLRLPDTDERVRFTLCLLLSEVFRSLFPDAWQYLALLTQEPEDIEGMLNYTLYGVKGDLEEGYIYVVEDSDIDLGLLDAVQRNLVQILEIVADFIDWHFEKMREPERADPAPERYKKTDAQIKRRNLFLRMADRIRKLFAKKEEDPELQEPEKVEQEAVREMEKQRREGATEQQPEAEAETRDYTLDGEAGETVGAPVPETGEAPGSGEDFRLPEEQEEKAVPLQPEDALEAAETEEPVTEDAAELLHVDGTDIFEDEGVPDDELWLRESFLAAGIEPIRKTRYQNECYLKYGFAEIDGRLRVEDVQKYLHVRGFCDNYLTKARKRDALTEQLRFDPENHCDFCGIPLNGVSYDSLNDGRVRCNDCSASAVTTVEEFSELFNRCLEMLELFYDVQYHVPISLTVADARKVAKGAGYVFRPSTDLAVRALGYAQRKRGKYSIIMENGSPRLAAIDTMVHELTHIWQYINWSDGQVHSIYGMNDNSCTKLARDIVYEGMAVWAAIQYLYQIGENYYASLQEAIALSRPDVYGVGFKLYCRQYPLVKDQSVCRYTPFKEFPTIDPDEVRVIVRANCKRKHCVC